MEKSRKPSFSKIPHVIENIEKSCKPSLSTIPHEKGFGSWRKLAVARPRALFRNAHAHLKNRA